MCKLIKSLLAVLVIYLFLLFSIHSLGKLRSKIYGEAQANGASKSYEYLSTFPVVME